MANLKFFTISKREELIVFSGILTFFMLIFYILPVNIYKFAFLPILVLMAILSTLFVARESLEKAEYFLLPVLPAFFTLSSALFYNIIPGRWLTRLSFILVYGFLIYSIFLIINIFNVAKIKNIQLLKVARTIYFFISSFSLFLFSYVVLSFHLYNFISAFIISLFAFIISQTFIWSFSLKKTIAKSDFLLSIYLSLIIFELSLSITFWPLNIYMIALFITSIYYSLIGIIDNILSFKLRGWSLMEYLAINIFVFLLCLLSINFG